MRWEPSSFLRHIQLQGPKRETSPILFVASVIAALVLSVSLDRDQWVAGTYLELLVCLAAALSGLAPRLGSLLSVGLLSLTLYVGGGTGLGAFAPMLSIVSLGIIGANGLRLLISVWLWIVLVWWTNDTLRPGESLTQYALFWFGCVATGWAIGSMVRKYLSQSKQATQLKLAEQRRGIARDLHDTVAHSLSLIVMRAEQARLNGGATSHDLQFIAGTADRSIQDLRSMMALLRESQSSEPDRQIWQVEPIEEVLHSSVEKLRAHGFIPVLNIDGDLEALPPSANEALAKVTHEATANIVKHAVPNTNCALMIEVTDTNADLVISSVPKRHPMTRRHSPLGLEGMRERIEALGGEFSAGPGAERWITQVHLPLR